MKRRILPILLSAALAFAAPMTTFAAEKPASPEAAEQVAHEYQSFQIFKGEEGVLNGNKVLLKVEWGADATQAVQDAIWTQIHADGFEVKDEKGNVIADQADATATDIARAIEAKYPNSEKVGVDAEKLAKVIAKVIGDKTGTTVVDNTTFTGDAGWYLIVDKTASLVDEYEQYKDRSQLKFLFNNDTFRVTTKRSVIEIFKTVKDVNDSVTVENPDGTSADYDIEDDVPFTLTATLPDNVKDYESYTFTINDRQDKGFDFPKNFKVTVDGVEYAAANYTVASNDYDNDGAQNDFDIVFGDVANNAAFKNSSKVVVTYTSKLNADAKIGNAGNKNESRITYNPDNEGEGHTPWDIVIVFTFKPIINKLDQDNNALEGAVFDLVKVKATEAGGKYTVTKDADGNDETVYTKTFAANGNVHSIAGIDDGVYKIVETTTPAGYNTIDPVYFVVVAEHNENLELVSLSIVDLDGNSLDPQTAVSNAMTASLTDGTITTDVINQKGVVLPSTGGIGTTIFYVIGGVLVVGAVVLLIVRRRMRNEEE